MDTTLASAPLSSEKGRVHGGKADCYLSATPHDYQKRCMLAEGQSYILVDLGDDEVAPVDEGDHLAL